MPVQDARCQSDPVLSRTVRCVVTLAAIWGRLVAGRKVVVPVPAFAWRWEVPVRDRTSFIKVLAAPISTTVVAFFSIVLAAPVPTSVIAVPSLAALIPSLIGQDRGGKGDHRTHRNCKGHYLSLHWCNSFSWLLLANETRITAERLRYPFSRAQVFEHVKECVVRTPGLEPGRLLGLRILSSQMR